MIRQDITFAYCGGHRYTPDDLGPNPTYLPDWLFSTCTPILVIRHPAFMVRSLHHTMSQVSQCTPGDEDFFYCASLACCRMLFDLFQSQGRAPIVVEGDDVVWRTQEMSTNVCNKLGIDPSGVEEQWEPTPQDQRHPNPIVAAFTKTIHDSTGVERPSEKVSHIQAARLGDR